MAPVGGTRFSHPAGACAIAGHLQTWIESGYFRRYGGTRANPGGRFECFGGSKTRPSGISENRAPGPFRGAAQPGCRGGSRYVEGCRGFPYLKIEIF